MPIVPGLLTAPQWDLLKAAMLNSGKVPLQNKRALPDVEVLAKGGYIEIRKGERLYGLTVKGRAAIVVERKSK